MRPSKELADWEEIVLRGGVWEIGTNVVLSAIAGKQRKRRERKEGECPERSPGDRKTSIHDGSRDPLKTPCRGNEEGKNPASNEHPPKLRKRARHWLSPLKKNQKQGENETGRAFQQGKRKNTVKDAKKKVIGGGVSESLQLDPQKEAQMSRGR